VKGRARRPCRAARAQVSTKVILLNHPATLGQKAVLVENSHGIEEEQEGHHEVEEGHGNVGVS
jgi:hypothetical protein